MPKHSTNESTATVAVVSGSADEIIECIKEFEGDHAQWLEEAKREKQKPNEIRDTGYIQHCLSIVTELRSQIRILKWVLGQK